MLFLIVDQIDMLANRIFFIRKSLSPYISSRPRLSRCKSAKFKRIPSQYTSIVTFTIHTTRYFDRLYAQRRSATCYIYHLYPHLYPTLYVYEFYEILISPWEIITFLWWRLGFDRIHLTRLVNRVLRNIDIQGSVKVLNNDFLWTTYTTLVDSFGLVSHGRLENEFISFHCFSRTNLIV